MKISGSLRAVATLTAPLSWGTSYLVITEGLAQRTPLFVATARLLPAGIVLAALGWLRTRWRPSRPELGHLAVQALFNFGAFFPLLIVAIYRLPGGVAAAVGGLQPLLVASLTRLWGREAIRRIDLTVGVVAATGVAMVVVRPGAGIDPVGVIAAIGANVSFAAGVVATRRLPTPADRIGAAGWQMLIAATFVLPLAVLSGPIGGVSADELLPIGHLSLVATALASVVWFAGIRRLPAAAPPILGLAAPLTGAALGWAVLGEELSGVQLIGFGLTAMAIIWAATVGSTGPAAGDDGGAPGDPTLPLGSRAGAVVRPAPDGP